MSTLSYLIEADCAVLILRALLEKEVVAFGDDGLGKFGRSSIPKTFTITDIGIDVACDDQTGDDATCIAKLYLDGYHKDQVGHVVTDQNLMISIRKHLIDNAIDPNCVKYAELSEQGDNFCAVCFDVPLLLEWS